MTEAELEKQFVRAEQTLDSLLSTWKTNGDTRRTILEALLSARRLPNGLTMEALCFAVMAERLIKEKNDKH